MKKNIILLICLLFSSIISQGANLDEMAGQMIIVGFNGDNVESKGFKKVLEQVTTGEISGVIFFEDNIKNKDEFIKMTSAIKNSGAKQTPFISIDMEGGKIQRMNSNNGFKNFKTAKQIAKLDEKQAYDEYYEMAKMLKDANINLNFAPVVDLAVNEKSIIEKKERSYSKDPKIVTKYAKAFIDSHYNNKIATSIKHFPGHGSPTGDTHMGFVDATNCHIDEELYPYIDLANTNPIQTVMVSHLYNKNIDDKYPASLSYKTINELLKTKVNFNGVIISDDLDMGAIKKNYKLKDVVQLAIGAGDNILIFSNRTKPDKNLVKKFNKYINQGIVSGKISSEDILNSYNKITKLKQELD